MAAGDAHWRVGYVTSLSSGTQAVTGLGGQPQAVFFWGTNFTTEDSAVTSSGTGLFRGMAAPLYSSPSTIIQDAMSVTPAGVASAQQPHAITMMDTSGTVAFQYFADLTSFDSDGFTLNWGSGSVSGHKVVYAALLGPSLSVAGYRGAGASPNIGFTAGASLIQGNWQWGSTGFALGQRNQMWFGGGAYPTSSQANWMGAGLSANVFPTSASAQYDIGIFDQNPTSLVAHSATFVGPFLTAQDVVAYPSTPAFVFNPNLADNGGMFVAWDDDLSATGRLTPPASTGGGTSVVLPFNPGLVTGYSISNEPQGQATGGRGAIGMSVCAPGFQWCATIDGVSSRGAFQSFQVGVADVVNGTNVHTAIVDVLPQGFNVVTQDDDVSPASWVWHAFGSPPKLEAAWIPHIYRRVM